MTVKAGKDFLIKIGDGAMSEAFTTLGGLRSSKMTINSTDIDVTTIDSNEWKELLNGAGIRSFAVSGSGLFDDSATLTRARTVLMANTIVNLKIYDPAGNIYAGAFKIKSMEQNGEYNGAAHYSTSLESSGAVTFTAHP